MKVLDCGMFLYGKHIIPLFLKLLTLCIVRQPQQNKQKKTNADQELILEMIEHLHADTDCLQSIRMWRFNQSLIFFCCGRMRGQ